MIPTSTLLTVLDMGMVSASKWIGSDHHPSKRVPVYMYMYMYDIGGKSKSK
jgi:hypothetical protein